MELQSVVAAYVNYSADAGQMREMRKMRSSLQRHRVGVNCRLMI